MEGYMSKDRDKVKKWIMNKLNNKCRNCGSTKDLYIIEDRGYFNYALKRQSDWTLDYANEIWPGLSLVCSKECEQIVQEENKLETEITEVAYENSIYGTIERMFNDGEIVYKNGNFRLTKKEG
jgi:hypothetical protein